MVLLIALFAETTILFTYCFLRTLEKRNSDIRPEMELLI